MNDLAGTLRQLVASHGFADVANALAALVEEHAKAFRGYGDELENAAAGLVTLADRIDDARIDFDRATAVE
jgi:ABC-type transporter Mla subunit MlaD